MWQPSPQARVPFQEHFWPFEMLGALLGCCSLFPARILRDHDGRSHPVGSHYPIAGNSRHGRRLVEASDGEAASDTKTSGPTRKHVIGKGQLQLYLPCIYSWPQISPNKGAPSRVPPLLVLRLAACHWYSHGLMNSHKEVAAEVCACISLCGLACTQSQNKIKAVKHV